MSTPRIAIMHYSSAPVVGGVESVIQEHSRLFAGAGYPVTIFSGRGAKVDEDVGYQPFDLLNSSNARILEAKKSLDRGSIPADFKEIKDEILQFLRQNLADHAFIFAHNICSLHKNLPLTAALFDFLKESETTQLISWDHDLAWVNPQYLPQLTDAYPWNLLKQTWHPTRHRHVTVSSMRRDELEQLLGEGAPSVLSIPSGIDWKSILQLGGQSLDIIDQYALMDAFPVLFLPARITRRKNIELAITITSVLRTAFPSIALVVSGPLGPHNPKNRQYFDELKQLTNRHQLDDQKAEGKGKVVFLADYSNEFLPTGTIHDLFRFADALLFPSFQEGFGIPIIEAGMVGMPIFCSDILPFHEPAGVFAHYFNPASSPDAIAEEMRTTIMASSILNHKKKVKEQFTWNKLFTRQIEPLVLRNAKKD